MPGFRGNVLKGQSSLAAYSQDMSGVRLMPRCVAIPADVDDIGPLFDFATNSSTAITPRGAGSNQSGSAVGTGMIVPTLKLSHVSTPNSGTVWTQAGAIHAIVDDELRKVGRTLAYDPSSRTFCTVGGNVATKASGLRGLKYGSVDRWLASARFFSPAFGAIDTRRPSSGLVHAITDLRDEALSDESVSAFTKRRKDLKSSSGYNLGALFDHEDPGEIAAHLLCGSVGTLGLISDVELRTIPLPRERALLLIFFDKLEKAIEMGLKLRRFRPSALELIDENGLIMMREEGVDTTEDDRALLMVEFDEEVEAGVASAAEEADHSSNEVRRLMDPKKVSQAWKVREAMLLMVKKKMETTTTMVPPFVEDLAVPPDDLLAFARKMLQVFGREGLEPAIYGHVGEGNLHFRPPIPLADRERLVDRLGDECVSIALSFGGTVTAEHGSGRLRLGYSEKEFGRPVLEFFDRIKRTFDPKGVLNPGVMPSTTLLQQ
ncbi:MAG: FAD-binding oxidoreductase [Methanomassiliicoccales archaeon]